MERILVYGMTDNPGGIETYLMNTASRMSEYGIVFDYVTDFKTIAYKGKIESMQSKIFFIPAKSQGLLQQWKKFYTILKKHPEYHTVYVNALDAGAALTCIVPFFMGRKIVFHSHNGSTDKMRLHRICRPLLKMICKNYVACSSQAGEHMFGKTRREIFIMPNAIDFEKYKYDERTRQRKREELHVQQSKVICHVGRLSMQKNPYRLIDIFDIVAEKVPEAVLLSVGSGELEDEVKAYAASKKCSDRIYFLGSRKDVPDILMASDVFILPSLYEGLSIAALEAQVTGIPCIFSNVLSREVDINGYVHFISLRRNNDQWAAAVCEALKEPRHWDLTEIDGSLYNIRNIQKYDRKLVKILQE